jgi:hypothetical protein
MTGYGANQQLKLSSETVNKFVGPRQHCEPVGHPIGNAGEAGAEYVAP